MRNRFLAILLVLAGSALPAASQTLVAPVYDGFNSAGSGFDLPGWTTDPLSTEFVGWAVDSSPANIVPGLPSTWSPGVPSLGSLNFNDGIDFDDTTDGAVSGGATSPIIDVSSLGTQFAVISFKVAISMEVGAGSAPPTMAIEVYDATTSPATLFGSLTIGRVGDGTSYEISQGQWTQLNAYLPWFGAGLTLVQIRFTFDSADAVNNGFSGMFIDEFRVSCEEFVGAIDPFGAPVAPIPPSTPTLLSPIGGATVTNPVAFDWTDSTDTTPCGPSGISIYQIQVDDDPAFGSINFTSNVQDSFTSFGGIPAGTWFWRVRALDEQDFNAPGPVLDHPGAFTAGESFFIEPEIAPDPPSVLYVNERSNGAQAGDPGFVDPVLDTHPAFSAIYTDANTIGLAIAYRVQVAADAAFTIIVDDTGSVGMAPLPKDTRCPDVNCNVSLNRDTVYFWRIAFDDGSAFLPLNPVSGLVGPFSGGQSFRIGDDFEFGIRAGSSHHGRRCWVATAAWGSAEAAPVESLQAWRFGALESVPAGRAVSRAYHVVGATAADAVGSCGIVRLATSGFGASSCWIAAVAGLMLALLGICRLTRPS